MKSSYPVAKFDVSEFGYTNFISKFPVLTPEYEYELAVKSRAGDLEASKTLILHNLRFVFFVVRGYKSYGMPQDDLMQAGTIGLMKALRVFEPERGVRFITQAVTWIKSEIHEFIVNNFQIIKMATTKAQRKLFFNLRLLRLEDGNKRMTDKEVVLIAKELNVPERDVRKMETRFQMGRGFSLNQEVFESQDHPDSYQDRLIDPSPSGEELLILRDQRRQLVKMHELIASLPERERDIITQRCLSSEPTSLQELAKKYNVSAERIRQLETKAIKTLRSEMLECEPAV